MRSGRPGRQGGFTYVFALVLLAVMGVSASTVAQKWSEARQREKQAELLWVGNQFRQAIGLYYHRSPGAAKQFPRALEELLDDKRFQTRQRYLRRIYADPYTGKPDWEPIHAPSGGIMGVRSASKPDRSFIYEPPLQACKAPCDRSSRRSSAV